MDVVALCESGAMDKVGDNIKVRRTGYLTSELDGSVNMLINQNIPSDSLNIPFNLCSCCALWSLLCSVSYRLWRSAL